MSNQQQNEIRNEIEQIRREINLLQDRLKKNAKSKNQFQNGLKQVKKIRIRKRQSKLRQSFSQTKKMQNVFHNILQNKIAQIKKEINLLQDKFKQFNKD